MYVRMHSFTYAKERSRKEKLLREKIWFFDGLESFFDQESVHNYTPDQEIREVGKKSIKSDRKLEWKIRILVKVDVNKRQKCKDWKSKN